MNTKFVHPDSSGQPWGVVSTANLWANVYGLFYNKPEARLDESSWMTLFLQAKDAAITLGAQTLLARMNLAYEPHLFRELFSKLGFKRIAGRIEYQLEVDNLPDEAETPLRWKTMRELGWTHQQLASFVSEVVVGALDVDPNENPEDFIKDWLANEELTYGPDVVAIGFMADEPVALTVAQVRVDTGWSRIAYMGIVPKYRGKGLGQWVHRHGFAMIKRQGGKLYHGGTHSENFAMRKLFESHGCRFFCEMEEWSFTVQVP